MKDISFKSLRVQAPIPAILTSKSHSSKWSILFWFRCNAW